MIEPSVLDQLRQLELRLTEPDIRRSQADLDQMLADDFREFGSSGRSFDKQQIIDALQHQRLYEISIQEFRAVALAPGVVLVTYRAKCIIPESGVVMRSLRSSIWNQKNGRWQIEFHQGTPMNDPTWDGRCVPPPWRTQN